ncbi:rhomboid-domain-containing protein [Delitschia confertaspora ATCC 74209]|uniref:Rhomboid-domain-containing protein n=1 Tax=Delitschia confertaspora ATCC 74209 TaxID=1513339 RepID=A0A9P4JQ50_9PLEO|nr:rhomboid-domain-containing protein [Delitschia confertaspora ATCC 74209]
MRHTSRKTPVSNALVSRLRPLQHRLSSSIPRIEYFQPSPSEESNMKFIWAVMAVNTSVFVFFWYRRQEAQQTHDYEKVNRIVDNFTLGWKGLQEGRWWTLVTHDFFHIGLTHIVFNMVTFFAMGQLLAATPGVRVGHLAVLLTGSGLSSAAGFLFTRDRNSRKESQSRALGFSGVSSGFVAAAACLHPTVKFALFGIIPAPAWALAGGFFAYDWYNIYNRSSGIAHAGHVGGAVFGALYWLLRLRKVRTTALWPKVTTPGPIAPRITRRF